MVIECRSLITLTVAIVVSVGEKTGIFPINPPKNTPISKKRVLIEHLKEKLEPRR